MSRPPLALVLVLGLALPAAGARAADPIRRAIDDAVARVRPAHVILLHEPVDINQ